MNREQDPPEQATLQEKVGGIQDLDLALCQPCSQQDDMIGEHLGKADQWLGIDLALFGVRDIIMQ